jgi:hypothetical protein
VAREVTRSYKFGGGALVASGTLFVVLAFLDFRAGPPPSNGAEILLWRDAQAPVLDFVSEFLFFATVLLVPGTLALYQSAYFGFATAALDIIGSYPWAIGPVLTLVCELSVGGWFMAVGSQLFRMRESAAYCVA